MPGGTIVVDPGALSTRVHVTKASDGTTPIVFNDAGLTSVCTLPVDIEEEKTLYVTANGSYLITVTVDGDPIYSSVGVLTGTNALTVDAAAVAAGDFSLGDLADVSNPGTELAGAHLVSSGRGVWAPLDPSAAEPDTASLTSTVVTGSSPTAVTGTAVTGTGETVSVAQYNEVVADIIALITTVNRLVADDGHLVAATNATRVDAGAIRTTLINTLVKLRAQHILIPPV
jgi:hypothetical protein